METRHSAGAVSARLSVAAIVARTLARARAPHSATSGLPSETSRAPMTLQYRALPPEAARSLASSKMMTGTMSWS